MSAISKRQILEIIEAGIQAPSPDNCQPWRFKLLNDGFELWTDPTQLGLFFDASEVATEISCGALLENVVTMADALGFETQVTIFEKPSMRLPGARMIACVDFRPGTPQINAEKIRQQVINRHTNRFLFRFNRRIPEETSAKLGRVVELDHRYRMHFYETPQHRTKAIELVFKADALRFSHRKIHGDFHKVLRFGTKAEETRDGLPEGTLGIGRFLISALKLLRPWWITRLVNGIGIHYVSALVSTWLPLRSSSLILSITHSGPPDYVDFGRVMQRFWLHANGAGLSVQPLGALPLFLARLHLVQGEGFSRDQLGKLVALEKLFSEITSGFHPETDQLVMLFRLGYARGPIPRSYRREVRSFLQAEPGPAD